MMLGMPKVSVQLSPDVHAAVRVRAFREGTSLAELGRRFFENYGGLAAGDQPAVAKLDSGAGAASPTAVPKTSVDRDGAIPSAPAASPDEETIARRNPVKTHGPDWKKGGK